MGRHPNISADKWPKQGRNLNEPCNVVFNYDTSRSFRGTVVRADAEDPYISIVKLDDGRHVLTTECQYQPLSLAVTKGAA